jgi:hypothetical protein
MACTTSLVVNVCCVSGCSKKILAVKAAHFFTLPPVYLVSMPAASTYYRGSGFLAS